MSRASIYKIAKKGYLLYALSKTVSGFYIATGPFSRIGEDEANVDTICNAIRTSLSSNHGMRKPDPQNWTEFDKIFLQKTGLKSLAELHRVSTKLIEVTLHNNSITFLPTTHSENLDEGFLPGNKTDAVTISFSAPNDEVAKALESAFAKCE
jgi:hypothetical protein